MDADEREILTYLKTCSGQFIGLREINRRAGGKWRYNEDPHWATKVVLRLVEKTLVEKDSAGHYRVLKKQKKEKRRWVSPQMKKILEQSGKTFELGEEEDV